MSTASNVAASTDKHLANPLFDHPGADLILRSRDSHIFRVPKIYVVSSSFVLEQLIRRTLDSPDASYAATSPPVVQLPERGAILHILLTFIFPMTPRLLSTTAENMELLSVAQTYQMNSVLAHIRGSIARHYPLPSRLEPALHIYSLAQKYGLRPEALQAARITLNYPMTIEDLDDKLDIIPGASLYELWKYHENVRVILTLDLTEFRMSGARSTMTGLVCTEVSPSHIPSWLDRYIESIGKAPNLFDPLELNTVMARHISECKGRCRCASIPSQTIRDFWTALASVVHGSFEKVSVVYLPELHRPLKPLQADPALCLIREREDSQVNIGSTRSPPTKSFDVHDANFILRSSDNVDFRVHKSVLAIVSPFFRDLLSLPQPPYSESVDGLSMVQLSEDSELLTSLVSMLYPVRPVIPKSYDKVYHLLVACQKYDMVSVQSSIRAEVNRGEFPAPKGAEAFPAYAMASSRGLIPEMEDAARKTLDYPLTFEILGEELRLFEGWALRDLASFRKRCRCNLVACLDSFLDVQTLGPSDIWVGCPEVMPKRSSWGPSELTWPGDPQPWSGSVLNLTASVDAPKPIVFPRWLYKLLSQNSKNLKLQGFTHPLTMPSRIRGEYLRALQAHASCKFCSETHIKNGFMYCAELETKLGLARDKVFHSLDFRKYHEIHSF
jgi:BTB/POZ domain-containing protein